MLLFLVDREDIWPGLTRHTAACTLPAHPTVRPDNSGPPCLDDTPYCALFEGHCQADIWGGPAAFDTQGGANQVSDGTALILFKYNRKYMSQLIAQYENKDEVNPLKDTMKMTIIKNYSISHILYSVAPKPSWDPLMDWTLQLKCAKITIAL